MSNNLNKKNICDIINTTTDKIINYITQKNNQLRYSVLNAYAQPRFNTHYARKKHKTNTQAKTNPNYYKNEKLDDKIIKDAKKFANEYENKTPFTKSFLFMLHLSYLNIHPEIIASVMLRDEGLTSFSYSSQKLKLENIKKQGFKSTKELYEKIKNSNIQE